MIKANAPRTSARLYRSTALGLSLALSLGLSSGLAAHAQDTATSAPTADEGTEVVVTGQRASNRSRLNTLVPVDVVTTRALEAQGSTELAQGLSRVAPSLNFPRPSGTDATDAVRPASLRGLSPDQTLVLVNGKRRHTSALVNINGSAGRGSVAVDLNAIPEAALSRVEVLRDGASAQYGSDAIAGVLNLHLREAREGGNVTLSYGEYDTDVEPANSSRHVNDGRTTDLSGWLGLPIGDEGFLTVSGHYRDHGFTNRADIDTDPTVASQKIVTARYGDPDQQTTSVFVNAGVPLNDSWKLYGNAGFNRIKSESAAFFRHSNASGNIAEVYPNGFLPLIGITSEDQSATIGVRGTWGEWTQDYSLTTGRNTIDFRTRNTINASYGAASPTSFNDGRLVYEQTVFNADLSRPFDVGLAGPLTLAVGLEARNENYAIREGELKSYAPGPVSGKPAGAQGFPGFQPSNVVDEDRNSIGVYANVAGDFTDKLSYDAAVRYEDYSDFGSNTSGKLALRYDVTDAFAVRGSISTGFRAPSLGQQFFTSTTSNLNTAVTPAVILETGTFPATSEIAQLLGAEALEPETSTSATLGFVWRKGPFEVTVDGYSIDIDDRIVLSENLSGGQITTLLAPYNVTAARFFINGVDTTTKGIDVVANYRIPTDNYGRFNLSLAWNNNTTEIDRLPTLTNSPLSPQPVLFARVRQQILTSSAPENKGTFAVDWSNGSWAANARATYYGNVTDPATLAVNDIQTGDHTLIDLSASYRFRTNTLVTIGADNVLDEYPDATPASLNVTSGNGAGALAFTRFSPFGFNGRYLYARVSQSF